MKTQTAKLLGLFSIWLFGLLPAGVAQQVEAELSQEYCGVGQPVRLNIMVTGARGAQVPQQLNIDGIDARFIGKSEQMQWQMKGGGMKSTSTSTFSYLIVPLRQGDFTIPPISVAVDGKTVKTSPLTLSVVGGQGVPVRPAIPVPKGQTGRQSVPPPSAQASPRSPRSQPEERKITFGDLIIPKKTLYVGEVVPVELRFYFDANYPARLPDRPVFSGEGFTVMPFSKPIEKQQEVDGRLYNVVIFQTAISAAKAGTLELSPASIDSQVQVPSRPPAGFDDFFGGFFGNMLSGDIRQITVRTQSAKLEVKPLPTAGRPEDFSGAVGQFSLQASATPKQAGAGDPISLNVTVSGRGNFDAMAPPVLLDAQGWRTYPPGEKFEASPSDPVGFNGEKQFEFMIVAREDQSKTPVARLSFFDPALEKYVTIKSTPIEVAAKGTVDSTAVAAAASPTAQPAPTAAPASTPQEGLLVSNFSPASFAPFAHDPRFLVANGALAVVWSIALMFGLGRTVAASSFAKKSAVRRDIRKLFRKLENPACAPEEFLNLAGEFVSNRLKADETGSDVGELLERSRASGGTKSAVRTILSRCDEGRYSPTGVKLDATERKLVLDQLRTFDHEMPR